MSNTVRFEEAESIRLTEVTVETRPSDRLEFTVRGNLRVTESLLAEFEGATLNPARVTVSAGDADPVRIDLTGPASLRLENVDVGVATPDGEDIADGIDALRPSADGSPGSIDPRPDVLSFTVDGEIRDVPAAALESIREAEPRLESLTFAVDGPLRSDGGSEPDVILELSLLGYGVVVRRDGSIVVGSAGSLTSIDLP